MHIRHENATAVLDAPLTKGLKLLQTASTEFVELTLMKGGNVPAHSLDIPVTFYVAEGRGTLAVDGTAFAISQGDMVSSKAGSTRELTNTGDGDLRVLVIKQIAES